MHRVARVGMALVGLVWYSENAIAAPFPGCQGGTLKGCPGTGNTTKKFITQPIDHFNWAAPLGNTRHTTYRQRYFINDQWWSKSGGTRGPIFFYFGNEDNVELYVNHTGLMWESAEEFGALLVFAEHRYYGESMPFPPGTPGCMNFLTTEQAMADFAYLIDNLRSNGAQKSAVIGFGGSYGGMIAAWFRIHYPQSVDGVIAASAPIWSFVGLDPPYDYNAFNEIVTADASTAGGATDNCKTQLKQAWPKILEAGETDDGRKLLATTFRTCSPLRQPDRKADPAIDDALAIVNWASDPWGMMAMGNYPYPSTYLMHGESLLPAFPVRAACTTLDFPVEDDKSLFEAVRAAAAIYHNNSFDKACFNITGQPPASLATRAKMTSLKTTTPEEDQCTGSWGYQWCTEMVQPFTQGTSQDMFYCPDGTFYPKQDCSKWDISGQAQGCKETWGVTPKPEWARVMLGGKRIGAASNIVFSNGVLDPWHGGGVVQNISDTLVSILIPNGAHHIDLMFSDPADSQFPDIATARATERQHMAMWVKETNVRNAHTDL